MTVGVKRFCIAVFAGVMCAFCALASEDIVLSNRYGRVSVSLMGAQVLSYVPAGGDEILFRPADMDFGRHERLHGGIPVCWPWFSRYGEPGSRMHGLARYCRWTLVERTDGPEDSSVVLTLTSTDETRRLWPHDFNLRYAIRLAKRLELTLEAENTGKDAFDVTEGFHPYFKANDPSRVTVFGLEKPLRVHPGIDGGRPTASGRRYAIVEDGADTTVEVSAEGQCKLVVWNPGPKWKGWAAPGNLSRDDWQRFVCVEPAIIGRESAVRVVPGGRHRLSMTIGRRPSSLDSLVPQVREVKTDGSLAFAAADVPVLTERTAIAGVPADVADQAYRIEIGPEGVRIVSGGAAGERFALATLAQLKKLSGGRLPCCTITDWPALAWRGFLLDSGRNWQPLDMIREVLDFMADYKYNVFHWHLTDYWGWRLESKAVPELSTDAATIRYVGKRYSMEDFLSVVDYAAERGITVMPEFDFPGHTMAFRRALGVKTMRDEKVDRAVRAFLNEFTERVPAEKVPRIHLGTDEVWTDEERVPDETMQAWARVATARGHKVAGWGPGIDLKIPGDGYLITGWSGEGRDTGHPHVRVAPYIDVLDPFEFLTAACCRPPFSDKVPLSDRLGMTVASWHDDTLGEEPRRIYVNNQVFPALVMMSESAWCGNAVSRPELGPRLPSPNDPDFAHAEDLERRMVVQRDKVLAGFPHAFGFVSQTGFRWRLSRADTGEVLAKDIAQATIRLPWPGRREGEPPVTNVTIVAETWIWSPVAQTVGAWIGFTGFDRSSGRAVDYPTPALGEWNRHGATVEVNGESLPPPKWRNPGLFVTEAEERRPHYWGFSALSSEIPLTDEEYYMRTPTAVRLRQGWNHVRLTMPPPEPAPYAHQHAWIATFVPVAGTTAHPQEVPGLRYSSTEEKTE